MNRILPHCIKLQTKIQSLSCELKRAKISQKAVVTDELFKEQLEDIVENYSKYSFTKPKSRTDIKIQYFSAIKFLFSSTKSKDNSRSEDVSNSQNFLADQDHNENSEKQQKPSEDSEQNQGTNYSNWMLARSQRANHNISHLRRKHLKDRFSIHKLTSVKFLCSLASQTTRQYNLNTNEKIILLSQLNHVFNLLARPKHHHNEFPDLIRQIRQELADPSDLVCLGTFMHCLTSLGNFSYATWQEVIDSLLVNKSDEEYDEIYGIVISLQKYRKEAYETLEYQELKNNLLLQQVPVIYRNKLELLRQFIVFNVYNLKECRELLHCLHSSGINERRFWASVSDWFIMYIKEQLSAKQFDEYFIMNEKAIEKVINDDGMIRARPILEEIVEVAWTIACGLPDKSVQPQVESGSQTNNKKEDDKQKQSPSQNLAFFERYIQFVENIVLYAMQNGSNLYVTYLKHFQHKVQTQNFMEQFEESQNQTEQQIQRSKGQKSGDSDSEIKLNKNFESRNDDEEARIKIMERKYHTLFVNPIEIKNQSIVQLLVTMRIYCERVSRVEGFNKENYNSANYIDIRVLKWVVIQLCKPQMSYTLKEILEVVGSRHFLKFSNLNVSNFASEKLKNLRTLDIEQLDHLKDLMLFLPLESFSVLAPLLDNFLRRAHPSEIHQLTKIIQMQSVSEDDPEYSEDFPRKKEEEKWLSHLAFFFIRLPEIVNSHSKYYSFEQNSYFLYYLLKNQVYWQEESTSKNSDLCGYPYDRYLGSMETLKEHIKIQSYSRGFKLQMSSYFYKLLNYVDLVEFFEGGNM